MADAIAASEKAEREAFGATLKEKKAKKEPKESKPKKEKKRDESAGSRTSDMWPCDQTCSLPVCVCDAHHELSHVAPLTTG